MSGRPLGDGGFDYSLARQKLANEGPIPSGGYWIRPDELWTNRWYHLASRTAWGNYRITIHPFVATESYGRGGFFIHGGSTPESAGCIDLTGDMDRFVSDLTGAVGSNTKCLIYVRVWYP